MIFKQKKSRHFNSFMKVFIFLITTFVMLVVYLAILDEPFKRDTQSIFSKFFWWPKEYKRCFVGKDWISSDVSSDTIANIFSENPNTFWEVKGPYPHWVQIDFKDSPRKIFKYGLLPSSSDMDSVKMMPKEWQFQSSNDGINWLIMDMRKDQNKWKNGFERKYAMNNPTAYRYYRIYITACAPSDVIRIGKLALYEQFLKTDLPFLSKYVLKSMSSKYIKIVLNKSSISSDLSKDTVANIADDNFNTFWEVGSFPHWIKIDFKDSPRKITRYSLRTGLHGTDSTERMPKDWQFQGSNDEINWITLDIQKNQGKWKNMTIKNYVVKNPATYRYYRLYIIAGVWLDILRIDEFSLYYDF